VGKPYDADERIEDLLQSLCYKRMGNIEKENLLKQKVAEYSLASFDNNAFMGSSKNSSTLLGAFVLGEMGEKDKADQMMNEWINEDENNRIAQWAMAAYSHDFNQIQKLEEDMKTPDVGTPWNPTKLDFSFELVKEIYHLLNRSL